MLEATDDPIEKTIGKFGRYQLWIYILITISRLPAEFQSMNVVFITPSVKYVCLDEQGFNKTNYCPCKNPKYDETNIVRSVTSEWNLICEREHLASLVQAVLQIGFLAGSIFYGYVSDRFGRKIAVILVLFSEALFGLISGVVPELWMVFVMRFFIGTAVGGTIICCYIISIELVGKSFKHYMLGLIEISYVSGYLLLPVAAYFIREWRYLQITLSVPWLSVILLIWFLPESPRWLITMGKKEEAIALLTEIAKRNGRPVTNIEQIVIESIKLSTNTSEQKHSSYLDLFKKPKLRWYVLIISVIWFCCTGIFYGSNQFTGRIEGNLYLNVLISASLYIPGLSILVVTSMYLNRKTTMITTFSLATTCLVSMTFISNYPSLLLTLAAISQISAYSSFVQLFLVCSEIFPTVIRNSATSFCTVLARVGGFLAPFIVNIGIDWVTLLILLHFIDSCFSILATLLCILLPETKTVSLLNSIQQTETDKKNDRDNKTV